VHQIGAAVHQNAAHLLQHGHKHAGGARKAQRLVAHAAELRHPLDGVVQRLHVGRQPVPRVGAQVRGRRQRRRGRRRWRAAGRRRRALAEAGRRRRRRRRRRRLCEIRRRGRALSRMSGHKRDKRHRRDDGGNAKHSRNLAAAKSDEGARGGHDWRPQRLLQTPSWRVLKAQVVLQVLRGIGAAAGRQQRLCSLRHEHLLAHTLSPRHADTRAQRLASRAARGRRRAAARAAVARWRRGAYVRVRARREAAL